METSGYLHTLAVGECATITSLQIGGSMRRRLLDIGFVPGTIVECVGKAPCGDPIAFCVRGAVIALRVADSRHITVGRDITWD